MRPLFDLALNELRLLFLDRSIWANLVIIPILITTATGLANSRAGSGGASDNVKLDVIDYDATPFSSEFQEQIVTASEAVRLCPLQSASSDDPCELHGQTLTVELAQQRLDENITAAFIIIPAGFATAARAGDPVEIVYRSRESAAAPGLALQAVQTAISRISATITAVRVGEQVADSLDYLVFTGDADRSEFLDAIHRNAQMLWATDPVQIQVTQPETAANPAPASGFGQSVPGVGSMYVLFAVLPMSLSFLRDRKQWTMQRLLTMPVSRAQVMGGKLLGYFVIGLIQFLVIFAFGYAIGLRFGSDPIALLVVLVAFTLAATGLALVLATSVKTEMQASSVSTLLAITLAPLGGAWWPLDIVPTWMRAVGHISPIAWAMDAFHALMYRDAGLHGVATPVGVLFALAAVAFTIGVVRFKFD